MRCTFLLFHLARKHLLVRIGCSSIPPFDLSTLAMPDTFLVTGPGASNNSGFNGLPTGMRFTNGNYTDVGDYGTYWLNEDSFGISKKVIQLWTASAGAGTWPASEREGHGLRCLRD